jgi:glucosyl-3-phosphoglycerate synthase
LSTGSDRGLEAIVVVPARDEEGLIGACLTALSRQHGIDRDAYGVILVLDDCRDQTELIARRVAAARGLHLELLRGAGEGSGAARALGMDRAHRRLIAAGRNAALIATTDADSLVAPDWLAAQLAAVRSGAEAIGGQVLLEESSANELNRATIEKRTRELERRLARVTGRGERQHPHFAGASIGVTAAAYGKAGGMRPLRSLEDEDFGRRLEEVGVPVQRLDGVRVTTSARTDGRAERGLAADLKLEEWVRSHSLEGADYGLEAALRAKDRSVSVVLPSREVASTIGSVLDELGPLRDAGLIEEVLVVDADSVDGTAEVAGARGFDVASESDLLPELGPCLGKGDAMRRGAAATSGEVILFLDTDTEDGTAGFALGVLGAFFCGPGPSLVKGAFRRPLQLGGVMIDGEGGRVTELVARPLINLSFPALAGVRQPLAGETAIDRHTFESLSIPVGYGVEIAMLIDTWRMHGLDAICQVDLGNRQNRHQDLAALGRMSLEVMGAARRRVPGAADLNPDPVALSGVDDRGEILRSPVRCLERPPLRRDTVPPSALSSIGD